MSGKSSYKRYMRCGPGGRNCPCCFPGDRTARKILDRRAKKNEREAEMELAFQELDPVEQEKHTDYVLFHED